MSEARDLLRRKTRRAFLAGGAGALAAVAFWKWIFAAESTWLTRAALSWNEGLWRRLFRGTHLSPEREPVRGVDARVNGDVGLEMPVDPTGWEIEVVREGSEPIRIALEEIRKLPRVEVTHEFKCVEGWSEVMSFAGVRFADFVEKFQLPKSGYVGLATPGNDYYVSLDIESMLHPQTLLCTEMNGIALSSDHGAPVRLMTTVKYGFKCLKRVASIRFSERQPPDYWAERGYDWYAAL